MESASLHIPSELFVPAESSSFEGTMVLPTLKAGVDTYTFNEPLQWSVDVTHTGEAFLVRGTVTGVAHTQCARCLDDVALPLTGDIEGYFLINGDTSHPEAMDEDEFEVLPDDHTIDLQTLIKAALLLEVPLVPLCSEDCKGLCAQCGANLNEGPCACAASRDDEFTQAQTPFSILKDFHFES